MELPERKNGMAETARATKARPWLTAIITLQTGQEVCPSCSMTDGDPFMPDRVPASTAGMDENLIKETEKKFGVPAKSYRFEYLSWNEIVERGYRENPQL